MEHLDAAGGVGAVMKALEPLLDTGCPAVGGQSIADYLSPGLSDYQTLGRRVINTLEAPLSPEGGIAVLKGNLAPDGGVVKAAAVAENIKVFAGPARCFDCEEDAVAAYEAGAIQPGEVIVVRYEGPAGGPGMREMLALTALISGGPLDGKVALVTDGRFSGGSRGAAIGHLSPEAASGGALGLVQSTATSSPSTSRPASIELQVDQAELAARRKRAGSKSRSPSSPGAPWPATPPRWAARRPGPCSKATRGISHDSFKASNRPGGGQSTFPHAQPAAGREPPGAAPAAPIGR